MAVPLGDTLPTVEVRFQLSMLCRFFVAIAFLGVDGKDAGQEKGSIE